MAGRDRKTERIAITQAHIDATDERVVSPSERAEYIWTCLKQEHPDLTDWDVLCFAGEYLGMMSPTYLWLEEPAKRVLGLIYTAHYMNPEQIDGESCIKRAPRKPVDRPAEREREPERPSNGDGVIRTRFEFG
jgi:hypothetical protein